jgi:hypothetical protein
MELDVFCMVTSGLQIKLFLLNNDQTGENSKLKMPIHTLLPM